MRLRAVLLVLTIGLAATVARAAEKYDSTTVREWTVLMDPRMSSDDILRMSVLAVVDRQLEQLDRLLPARALAELHKVVLYLSYGKKDSNGSAAYYHSDSAYLIRIGGAPEMYQNIELLDVTDYSRVAFLQPDILLHEFAHAYMHRVLPRSVRGDVLLLYFDAVRSHVYDSVEHRHEKRSRAYALKNFDEYFAEGSVAFFDTNQTFPFTRSDLQAADPELENLLVGLWYHPEQYDPERSDRPTSIITNDTVVSGWRFRYVTAIPTTVLSKVIDRFIAEAHDFEVRCPEALLSRLKEIPVRVYTEESHWLDSALDHVTRRMNGKRGVEIAIGKPDSFADPKHPIREAPVLGAALFEAIGGFDSAGYIAARDHATKNKLYGGTLEGLDKSRIDVDQLYIDALTRSYFNAREGYPSSRDELKAYDPQGFQVIENLWSLTK